METADAEEMTVRARLRDVRGLSGMLLVAVMLAGPPLMALTFSVIAPVLPAIAAQFAGAGSGAFVAQWIMTTPAIGLMLGAPAGGLLLERFGARRLVIGALAGFALGGSAGLYADSLALLLIGRFLIGLSGAILATGTTWLIAARHTEHERRRLIAAQDALSGLAALIAVLASGHLGQTSGWRAPFAIYLIALPLLVCAAIAIPLLPRLSADTRESEPASAALLRLWPIYLLVALLAGLMMMPSTQVPFVLETIGVHDPVMRSRVIAASALLSIISAASFPWVRARAGERGTLCLILACFGAGTALISVAPTAAIAALGCACMGAGTGLFSPHFASLIIARAEPSLRARAIGLMFGFAFLSEFLSPAVVLPLRASLGVQGGFAALSALIAIGLLVALGRTLFPMPSRKELR